MKYLSVLILLISVYKSHSQTKKYNFLLPQRDTVAFRPYQFSGTYKNGVIFYNVQFEKDFDNPVSTSVDEVKKKPNGQRSIKFHFEFYDSRNNLLLDTATAFHIELFDGYAIPPFTDLIRFKYKIPEPYKVKFTWSFYNLPDLYKQTKKVFVWNTSHVIDLYKYNEDYTSAKFIRGASWHFNYPF